MYLLARHPSLDRTLGNQVGHLADGKQGVDRSCRMTNLAVLSVCTWTKLKHVAEHGIGKIKKELLGDMLGDAVIDSFRRLKRKLDPNWILGSGILFTK